VAERYGRGKPVTVREIAEKERLAADYVEQILFALKKEGVLKSIRGKIGGYVLFRPPEKITASDIVKAIDKSILEPVCFRKKGRRNKCVHFNKCKIRSLWVQLKDTMETFLDSYTLEELGRLRKRESLHAGRRGGG
jgi:Rrf2 family protein